MYLFIKIFIILVLSIKLQACIYKNNHIQIFLHIIKFSFTKKLNYITENCILPDGEIINLDWLLPPTFTSENIKQSLILNIFRFVKYIFTNKIPNALPNDLPKNVILLINPGLFGNTNTLMGNWIKEAHLRKWTVCIHNRRGHDKQLTRPKWNMFGSVDDLHYITKNYINKRYPNAKLLMLGISAGSGLTIRYLGEHSNQYIASAGISGGYGIEKSMGRIKNPYRWFILYKMISFCIKNKKILENIKGYNECINAKDPKEFLDNAWAMAGYSSKKEYYHYECAMKTFTNIKDPLLLINAEDDPIAVLQNCIDYKYILNKVNFILTKYGSHCAFLQYFNFLQNNSFAENAIFEFFDLMVKNNIENN